MMIQFPDMKDILERLSDHVEHDVVPSIGIGMVLLFAKGRTQGITIITPNSTRGHKWRYVFLNTTTMDSVAAGKSFVLLC